MIKIMKRIAQDNGLEICFVDEENNRLGICINGFLVVINRPCQLSRLLGWL